MRNKVPIEDYVYNELKNAIFNKKIPLNTQLNENALSEAFNVSRTPIRNVFKRLQQERIVQNVPNKGTFIYQPTQKEIEDVFQLRMILETEAAKIACQIATEKQFEELEGITVEEERFFREGDYRKGLEKTSEFHQELLKLAGNNLMSKYNEELINITNIFLAYHDTAMKESPLSPEEHRSIINTLRTRDEAKVIEVMKLHFKNVIEHLRHEKEERQYSFSEIFKPYK